MVGACLGAKYGLDGIPREWMEKTKAINEVLVLAIKMAKLS